MLLRIYTPLPSCTLIKTTEFLSGMYLGIVHFLNIHINYKYHGQMNANKARKFVLNLKVFFAKLTVVM